MSLPSVSYSRFDTDFEGFSRDLGASFGRYGFAVIADHDLDAGLVERALDQTRAFFALPDEVKRRYHVPGGGGQRGYTPFGVETAKGAALHDLKEFWHMGRELPPGHPNRASMPDNVWPDADAPDFRPAVQRLYAGLDQLGNRVLRAIARHLGLADGFFEPTVRDGNSVLRLLHYPPVRSESGHVRASAHEDINAITLLLGAEEAGLEVKDRDGKWLAINPPAGAVVCNVGDMLQRLTNHTLPSTSHRVVNPAPERRGAARYSTPFFLHFAPDYEIVTIPSCISSQRPDLYPKSITADAYLRERLAEIKLS